MFLRNDVPTPNMLRAIGSIANAFSNIDIQNCILNVVAVSFVGSLVLLVMVL